MLEKTRLISILGVNNSSDVTHLDEPRPLRTMAGQLQDPIQSNYIQGGLWRDAFTGHIRRYGPLSNTRQALGKPLSSRCLVRSPINRARLN